MTATAEVPVAPVPIPVAGAILTSMHQFNALPVGSVVSISNGESVWERVADRDSDGSAMWKNRTVPNSLPIRAGNFAGAVNGGQVIVVSVPSVSGEATDLNVPVVLDAEVMVGQVFVRPDVADNMYVVVRVEDRRVGIRVHVAQFRVRDGQPEFHRMTYGDPSWFRARPRYPVAPEWARAVVGMGTLLLDRSQVPSSPLTAPEGLVADLSRVAAELQNDRLDAVLNQHGIATEQEHEIEVRMFGHILWTPDMETVRRAGVVSRDHTIDDLEDGVTVRWSRMVTLTKMGRGCVCDQVTTEDLDDYLPADAEDWDFETSHTD